jgi:hypothetical protein
VKATRLAAGEGNRGEPCWFIRPGLVRGDEAVQNKPVRPGEGSKVEPASLMGHAIRTDGDVGGDRSTMRWTGTAPRALAVLIGLIASLATARGEDAVSLDGVWQVRLDRDDAGLSARWWAEDIADGAWPDHATLPGAIQNQGLGDPIAIDTKWTGQIMDRSFFTDPKFEPYRQPGDIKVPFWLQPDRHYVGPVWFRRVVTIPGSMKGRVLRLTLERPHWTTRVWLDGRDLGTRDSLSTPHVYNLGMDVAAGDHTLVIRVDNRMVVDVGENAHSVSDHTQGNWNGVVGRMAIQPMPATRIVDLRVTPDARGKAVHVTGNLTRGEGGDAVTLRVERPPGGPARDPIEVQPDVLWDGASGVCLATIPLGDNAMTWDEFNPHLYRLTVRAGDDVRTVRFGLRTVAAEGRQLTLNGHPLFLRGTLDCASFPKTGYPPTDVAEWRRIIRIAKDHGLNHIRFHSWCPPEAAFVAADELGFYYQVECAAWASVGDGGPQDRWLIDEAERIIDAYGNHPSFLLLAHGNEPGGKHHPAYLAGWVEHMRKYDRDRRLITSASGWPQIAENQFHVTPDPRIQAWGEGLKSRINSRPPETTTDYREYIQARAVPVVSHEIGQWCVYPDFDEIARYTGPLKAKNFEIFRDFLAESGQLDRAKAFLNASGKLQTLCYKEEIESALRTPEMGGFALLGLQDFPGQGTALVGVLDPMWNEKGYVTPGAFRRFCGPTVPLVRLSKRVFTTAETIEAKAELAHFGERAMDEIRPSWVLIGDDGRAAASGRWPGRDAPIGTGIELGTVRIPLADVPAPARYRLELRLDGTTIGNDWDVWVYPETVASEVPDGVKVVGALDEAAVAALNNGERVVWFVPPSDVANAADKPVILGFSSIFWNTAWTKRQAPTTLGILCDPKHPALAGFPTDSHSDWQWWYAIHEAAPLILDGMPAGLHPIVQVIDDWFTAHRLGLVVEAKVGAGRLLICSIDLADPATLDPVRRQLRASLLEYAADASFRPAAELTVDQLKVLVRSESK